MARASVWNQGLRATSFLLVNCADVTGGRRLWICLSRAWFGRWRAVLRLEEEEEDTPGRKCLLRMRESCSHVRLAAWLKRQACSWTGRR